jgi:hypothetical protein
MSIDPEQSADAVAQERRQGPRRSLLCIPQITSVEGTEHWDCTLVDISAGGVRLKLDHPHEVPEEFRLSLTNSRRLWRRCRVVWRTDAEIGARYVEQNGQ